MRTASPRTEALLSSGNPQELDLAVEIQGRFQTLDFAEADGRNPWKLRFATLFNSSNSKEAGQLLRGSALEAEGFLLQANKHYVNGLGQLALPVYEGQMANRWDHRARTYEGFNGKDRYGRKPHIPWVTEEQHSDPAFEVEPRYWMYEDVAQERLNEVLPQDGALIAFREVGAVWTNRRIARGCLYPNYPATHKLPMLALSRERVFHFLALFNSMTFDFITRLHTPGGSLNAAILSQCAAPSPSEIPTGAADIAVELSVTSHSLSDLMDLAVSQWNAETRDLLDARCDALVAHAYGLSEAEYQIVLDHFQLLARIETRTRPDFSRGAGVEGC